MLAVAATSALKAMPDPLVSESMTRPLLGPAPEAPAQLGVLVPPGANNCSAFSRLYGVRGGGGCGLEDPPASSARAPPGRVGPGVHGRGVHGPGVYGPGAAHRFYFRIIVAPERNTPARFAMPCRGIR
jgi:hypothetical protein